MKKMMILLLIVITAACAVDEYSWDDIKYRTQDKIICSPETHSPISGKVIEELKDGDAVGQTITWVTKGVITKEKTWVNGKLRVYKKYKDGYPEEQLEYINGALVAEIGFAKDKRYFNKRRLPDENTWLPGSKFYDTTGKVIHEIKY